MSPLKTQRISTPKNTVANYAELEELLKEKSGMFRPEDPVIQKIEGIRNKIIDLSQVEAKGRTEETGIKGQVWRLVREAREIIENNLHRIGIPEPLPEGAMSFKEVESYLKREQHDGKPLEEMLEGGSLEACVARSESFYREYYEDPGFRIDRNALQWPRTTLVTLKEAIIKGVLNFAFVEAYPSQTKLDEIAKRLNKPKDAMTTARCIYETVIKKFKGQGGKFWTPSDIDTRLDESPETKHEDFCGTYDKAAKTFIPDKTKPFVLDGDNWKEIFEKLQPTLPKQLAKDHTRPTLHFTTTNKNPAQIGSILRDNKVVDNVDQGNRTFIDTMRDKDHVLSYTKFMILGVMLAPTNKTNTDDYLLKNTWTWARNIMKASACFVRSDSVGLGLGAGVAAFTGARSRAFACY